ncbi:hypothetical protein SOCE26_010530 [Sorangium cellulosum]|uniref:DUF4345 domain-containing protein n=1 Tax=Sorangium cellulosum TaxID=56 RepID=A0A2L0EK64_SORCE|nr:hypothetical protein [Sorangium cellulosum]AUX39658.1 hypothetical protein SOCE26_010530 [Sorangium cellulosum]
MTDHLEQASAPATNRFSLWFGRVVLLGVAVNLALALPAIVSPEALLSALQVQQTAGTMWPNFAALLLSLLSLAYIPGARDPRRNRESAWLAVGARFAGATFFLATPFREQFALFGVLDLSFAVPELILLHLALRPAR